MTGNGGRSLQSSSYIKNFVPRSLMIGWAVIGSMLMNGAPVAAQETPERLVSTETFESWILTCVENGDSQACEINQNIADASGQPLMQLQVGRFNARANDRAMVARIPVDITATMPIVWSAGETSIVLTLRACMGAFCLADGPISEGLAQAILQTAPQAQTRFTFTRANGSTVAVPLSLTGFSDAWSAMVVRSR